MSKDFNDFDDLDDLEEDGLADLTPEQYDKLMEEIENFNDSFFSHLAGTANYEVVPTETEDGYFLKEEHYKIIKRECAKSGAVLLYSYKVGNDTIIINPKSMKSVLLKEGELH